MPNKHQISFREARDDDLAQIIALLADDVLGRTRESYSQAADEAYRLAFRDIEADPNALLLVAVADVNRICGCLQINILANLSRKGTKRGQIEGVRIARLDQGRGLGHRLLEQAIDICRKQGCGMVQLTMDSTRQDARRFYESLGFEATHIGFKKICEPGFRS